MPATKWINWILLIILGIIWGVSFIIISIALQGYSPLWIASFRIFLAALFLYSWMRIQKESLPRLCDKNGKTIWFFCFWIGLFSNVLPFSMLSWGQQYVASSIAGISMAALPLIIAPLAHFLVPNEKMSLTKSIGLAVGFAGIVILIGPASFLERSEQPIEILARIACIVATTCYAIGIIITRLCPTLPKISLATATMLCACVQAVPFTLVLEGVPQNFPLIPTLAILSLGLFSTALGNLIQISLVRDAGANFASLVNYHIPLWSVFFGWLVLKEHLPAPFFIALALILLGLLISRLSRSQGKTTRKNQTAIDIRTPSR